MGVFCADNEFANSGVMGGKFFAARSAMVNSRRRRRHHHHRRCCRCCCLFFCRRCSCFADSRQSFSCAQGFSGCNTQKDIVEKRKVEYKDFTNKKVDSFWTKFDRDPQHAIKAIVRSGGSGAF